MCSLQIPSPPSYCVNNKSKKYEEVLCKDSQEELMDDDSGSLVFLILEGAESGQPSPRTLETTLSYERETLYHNAWEYFATCTIQYDEDPEAGHITRTSFWHNYNTWGVGAAYKPCVTRGRNHHGSLRVGASAGSDLNKAIGAVHVGYEHTYNLYDGWSFFFSVKEDITIRGKDRFKTGVNLGLKIPL